MSEAQQDGRIHTEEQTSGQVQSEVTFVSREGQEGHQGQEPPRSVPPRNPQTEKEEPSRGV